MADAFRGLTLRIGADARPLQSAIGAITRSASQAQKQMNRLDKAMKFDGANVKMMASKLDLVGDKGAHSARAVQKISTAMRQAVAEAKDFDLKKVASQTQDAYSATQKLRDEYNHVDASLQHIYDAVGRVAKRSKELEKNDDVLAKLAMRMNKLSANDAVEYVKKLRKEIEKSGPAADEARYKIKDLVDNASLQDSIDYVKRLKERMKGTGDEADKAASEFKRLMEIASKESGINELFGQQKGDVQALINEMNTLISRHNKLNTEHDKMKTVQGYRSMQAEVEVFSAEVRKAAADAARLRTEIFSLGTGGRLKDDVNHIKQLSTASEKAVASAHQMIDAYKVMPNSLERWQAKTLAVKTAEATLKAETEQIRAALKKIESDPAFDKVAASSKDAYTNAMKLENQYTDLTTEMKLAEAEADQLRQTLKAMSVKGGQEEADEYRKLTTALVKADNKVEKLKGDIAAMDDSHAGAALVIQQRHLGDQLAKNISLAKSLHSQVSKLNAVSAFGKGARELGFGMYASVTPAIMMAGRYAIQAAEDVDSAYRDMRKTVNGTEEDFEHLKAAALEYSTMHVTSADTILEIEAMGGQLGLAVSDLEAFAETISNLDIATNIDSDEAAEKLGKMASVVGISSEEYDEFGDALVRLGNNMPVLESDIMTVMPRFMGMGKVVGMTADEMLGWSAAASATGMGAEAAGSSMQRFISKMETAVAGSDEDLQAWADVAGMSVEEFRDSFGKDASATMYQFIEGLGDLQKNGESVNQTLMALGFNNVRDKTLLEGFANQVANSQGKVNLLADSLEMASDAYNGVSTQMADGSIELAGDAAREAQKKSEGFSGSMQMMRNQAKVLAVELAEGAVPAVQTISDWFSKLATTVHEMPDSMKTSIVEIAGFVAAIGPASVAIGTLAQTFARIGGVIPKISGGFVALGGNISKIGTQGTKLGTTMTKLGGAVKTLGSAGGMIGLAAAGIAIGFLVDAIGDYIERQKQFKKATEGFSENAEEIRNIAKTTSDDVRESYASMFDVDLDASEIKSKVREVTEANAELSDSTSETLDAAVEEGAKVQYYGDLIMDLAGNCEGSAAKMELLKDAVKNFNDLTGSDLQIVNNVTGDLSGLNDEIERNIELVKQKALVNGFSEIMQNTATEMANTSIAISQAEQTQADSLQTLTDLGVSLEEVQALAAAQVENGAAGAGRLDTAYESWYETLVRTKPELRGHEQELRAAYEDYIASADALEELNPQYEGLNEQLDATASSLEEATGKFEADKVAADEAAAAARAAATYQAALGDSIDFTSIAESVGFSADAVDDFSTALYNAGISAEEFASMGVDQFNVFREQAAAATADATQQVNLIGAAWSVVNTMEIDPKHVEITDDGKIKLLMDDLSEVEKEHLVELDVEVNDEGVIENVSNLTNQANELNATTTVTVDADTSEAEAELGELDAEAEALDGETVDVYAEADTGEAEGELEDIRDTAEEGATMPIDADTEALQSVLGEMLSSGDMSINATVNFTSPGFEEVNSTWESLKSSVAEGAQGVLTFDTTSMEQAIEVSGNLKMAIENIPEARGIYITVLGDALSTISSIWWDLAMLPTYKEIEIRTIHSSEERAAGGVFTKFAAGGMIPSHAQGALNGIVRSATLTNIGWVGEAGAEAVMHMSNAGGAVVPLTNRRYVRPFARAVAYEAMDMGGYEMRGGDTYNTTINTTGSGDELARTLTGALNTYSRLHGRGRRR